MSPRFIVILIIVALLHAGLVAQHLSSSRGIGIGAYTSLTNDLSSLDWNPAGLMGARDWEFSASNSLSLVRSAASRGMRFQMLGGMKRFLETHSFAVRYSPGLAMEFVIPSTFQFAGTGPKITFNKRITYRETYSLGYGYQLTHSVAVGLSARYREEHLSDTRPFFEQDTIERIRTVEFNSSSYNVDFGILWAADTEWNFGVVAKNIFRVNETEFPQEIRSYSFRPDKSIRLGLSYRSTRALMVAIDYDTQAQAGFGMEWNVLDNLRLRTGTYLKARSAPFFTAVTAGVGWQYESARFDLGFVRFFDRRDRSEATVQDFLTDGVKDITFNQFTTDQFTLTVNVPLGRTRELLARIEHVDISTDVYPASYQVHAYRPLGKARVKNISGKPIEARVAFYVDQFMDRPTETRPYYLEPNAEIEVPFTAIFNDAIRFVPNMVLRAAEVFVKASPTEGYDDKSQARLVIRGRNDWDGDVISLRYFITPEDPELLRFSRDLLNQNKEELANGTPVLEKFRSAATLFNAFAGRLAYVNDPRKSKDRVQYPSETLALRGGDCDDMTVCFSSLLGSIGLATAMVDVIPPSTPQEAHIYMMFDTEVPAAQAHLISENPKRYVIRKNQRGKETVWIPIETTVITEGFTKAWEVGARQYLDDVEMGLGLGKGWVRVVDILPR